ncbi:MAG: YihY/virulence factor BrkB family protein [Chloroflexi bacterium]|jgi:membrane protein|nr:YihY/virulence factor BrkB family protein [Chloroflexota bacterium]
MAKWKEKLERLDKIYKDKSARFMKNLKHSYHKLNNNLRGIPGIVRHAFTNLGNARGAEASAALAYYGLFSIFPALIAVVTIGSLFLDINVVRTALFDAVGELFPVPETIAFVDAQLGAALKVRGALTAIATISLIWSASNVIDKVVINVNRAFPYGDGSNFLRNRGLALVVIIIVLVLFLASVSLKPLFQLLPAFSFAIRGVPFTQTKLWGWVSLLIPLILKFAMFYISYTWLPNSRKILKQARAWGALVAALLWEGVTKFLSWAIAKGFANYELLYGSLASVMVLLFWLYWTGYILFLGAHITNAVNYHYKNNMASKKVNLETETA